MKIELGVRITRLSVDELKIELLAGTRPYRIVTAAAALQIGETLDLLDVWSIYSEVLDAQLLSAATQDRM